MSNSNSATILRAFYAAVNAKDLAQAGRLLAEDVCFVTINGAIHGKAAVCQYLQALTTADVTFAIHVTHTVNNSVAYSYRIFAQGAVIDAGEDGLAHLSNDLINFDGTTTDNFQEEQQ